MSTATSTYESMYDPSANAYDRARRAPRIRSKPSSVHIDTLVLDSASRVSVGGAIVDIITSTWSWVIFVVTTAIAWYLLLDNVDDVRSWMSTKLDLGPVLGAVGTTLSFLVISKQTTNQNKNESGVKAFFSLCGSIVNTAVFARSIVSSNPKYNDDKFRQHFEDLRLFLKSYVFAIKYTFRDHVDVDIDRLPLSGRTYDEKQTRQESMLRAKVFYHASESYGVTPVPTAILMLIVETLNKIQDHKGLTHSELQIVFRQIDGFNDVAGAIEAAANYSPPMAFDILRVVLFGIYFFLFAISLALNNSYNAIWLSLLIAIAFQSLYGVAELYANPFSVRSTTRGQKAHISIAARDTARAVDVAFLSVENS